MCANVRKDVMHLRGAGAQAPSRARKAVDRFLLLRQQPGNA